MGVDQVWTNAHRLAPLRFRPAFIVLFCEGISQLVVSNRIVRIIVESALQRVNGAVGVVAADLHLALVDERIHVFGVGLENFVVQFGGVVETVLKNQKLDVVFLGLEIFGVIVVERSVLSGGFIEIAGGEIEVAEHTIAFRGTGKIFFGLTQEGLDLVLLAFLH